VTISRRPDETLRIAVPGGNVRAYRYGKGDEVVLGVSGGPGMPCDYLREPHAKLADSGFACAFYDPLGCGASDKPQDPSLWTMARSVLELEAVRKALGLTRVHLLGQSWGAVLSIEYALTHPEAVATLTLANGAADIPHLVSELLRLREALGSETVAMMQRHEAEGTFEHPEYEAAITILYRRHICRSFDWPEPLKASFAAMNLGIYKTMWGANEYCVTGNLKNWSRLADLHRLTMPTLILVGLHDELTPACSRLIHERVPNSKVAVFQNSSHMPFYEEPEAYFGVVKGFLEKYRG